MAATDSGTGLSRPASPQRSAPAANDVELAGPVQPAAQPQPHPVPNPGPDQELQTADGGGSLDDGKPTSTRFVCVATVSTVGAFFLFITLYGVYFGGQLDGQSAPSCWNRGGEDAMDKLIASNFVALRNAFCLYIACVVFTFVRDGDEEAEDRETNRSNTRQLLQTHSDAALIPDAISGKHGSPAGWTAIVESTTEAPSRTLSDQEKVTRVIGLKNKTERQLRKMLKMRSQQVDKSANADQLREQLRASLLADPEWLASPWAQARDARDMSQRKAAVGSGAKLLCWHWSQPLAYLGMLVRYRCFLATLNEREQYFATIVATREVLYLGSTLFATWQCPVFLLMDPITAWKEAAGCLARCKRAGMWVLTPHVYTACCLIKHVPSYGDVFRCLMFLQICADAASCFALASLLAHGFENEEGTPWAITVGYAWTSFGFLLFFGPPTVWQLCFKSSSSAHHVVGFALLFIWIYFLALLLTACFGINMYCWPDPCNGHGECYGAGQCRCTPGYGPEVSYSGEPLCAKKGMACTLDQVTRAFKEPDPKSSNSHHVCCSGLGDLTAVGCICPDGSCPTSPDDPLAPTTTMCSKAEQVEQYTYPCRPYGCGFLWHDRCYEECYSYYSHC